MAAVVDELPIVLLTRDEHAQGKWLVDLAEAITAAGPKVAIVRLSELNRLPACRCLVNRVSDAAPPADVKIAFTALRTAELRGVPVVNGTASFALATSKLLHYELFAAAGLATPPYCVVRRGADVGAAAANAGLEFPLLLKPNSGGFGKGIVRLETSASIGETAAADMDGAFGEDGVAVLQEYAAPDAGKTYRVWFHSKGEVHCAVSVEPQDDSYNACVCSVPNQPWDVPADVAAATRNAAKIAGAECGSVELLYHAGRPMYFDFNLLSTLPDNAAYEGLAEAIIDLAAAA